MRVRGISQSSKEITVGGTRIVDFFFYGMLFFCLLFQTWGFAFTDSVYVGVVALSCILVASKVISMRYTPRDLIVSIVLVGLGVYFALSAHRYTILLSAVLLIAAKDIDIDELLGRYLSFKVIALVSLFALAAVGVFDVTTSEHFRMSTGAFETRVAINGVATNIVHLGLFTVAILWLYRKYGDIQLSDVALWLVLDFALYYGMTRSLAGLIMTAFGVLLMYLCSRFKGLERMAVGLSPYAPFTLMVLALLAGVFYGSSEAMDALNRFSTGRIAYDHYWLSTYGVTLFGADFSQLTSEGNFDDSFVYILVIYGAVFAAILYGAVTAMLSKMRGAPQRTLVVLLFLVYSLAESMYPSAVVNPSLFLLCDFIFSGSSRESVPVDERAREKARSGVGGLAHLAVGVHLLRRDAAYGAAGDSDLSRVLAGLRRPGEHEQAGCANPHNLDVGCSEPGLGLGRAPWRECLVKLELPYANPVRDHFHLVLLDSIEPCGQAHCGRIEQVVPPASAVVGSHVRLRRRELYSGKSGYAEKHSDILHGFLHSPGILAHIGRQRRILQAVRDCMRAGIGRWVRPNVLELSGLG